MALNCLPVAHKLVNTRITSMIFEMMLKHALPGLASSCFRLLQRRTFKTQLKRFFKEVTVKGSDGHFELFLDGRKLKTPLGNNFYAVSEPLALAVANEWQCQRDVIKPSEMHLTSLANTAIDNPMKMDAQQNVAKMLSYLESDTLCYHVNEPPELSALQVQKWNPVIKWFEERFQCQVPVTSQVEMNQISRDTSKMIERHLLSFNHWSLVGLQFCIDNLKSLILSMALVEKKIAVDDAVSLSLLEEDFQTSRWGTIEWAHDLDRQVLRARVSAAALFVFLSCEDRQTIKRSDSTSCGSKQ